MKSPFRPFLPSLALCAGAAATGPAAALTGTEIGPSGKTYASAAVQCALHPVAGLSPMVHAGLYNPKKSATGEVSLNGTAVATVSFISPDATLWLSNAMNTVVVALNRRTADSYTFDAMSAQANVCLPDTSGNTVAGALETAASGKSSATVTPGCAFNPLTGRAQPYVNLFDNGNWMLNVSVNNVALTQLGSLRPHTPVFLAAGWNLITAANGALSTDAYVRHGGSGSCTLP